MQDRLASQRRDTQLGRRATQERVDEKKLVEVELTRTTRRGESDLDLESRAAAGRQRSFCCDSPARDEECAEIARIDGRDEHAALEQPHPFESLQLAADALECRNAVAEPAGVLEP